MCSRACEMCQNLLPVKWLDIFQDALFCVGEMLLVLPCSPDAMHIAWDSQTVNCLDWNLDINYLTDDVSLDFWCSSFVNALIPADDVPKFIVSKSVTMNLKPFMEDKLSCSLVVNIFKFLWPQTALCFFGTEWYTFWSASLNLSKEFVLLWW